FSAQILSLKPEVHSTNEDKLCVKVLKKTAFAPFFIALIKFKKNDWFTWPERVPDLPVEFYTTV
ncbi:hypothetical protein, partial [Pseudomonas aeruginosa]